MATIRCSVRSCHFYGEGDYCTAEEIYVKNRLESDTDDDLAGRRDMEVGSIVQQTRGRRTGVESAQTSSQTCCETFRPKGEQEY